MEDAGRPDLVQQFFHDRFASDTHLAQAAVEGADRERHSEPRQQELADAAARLVVAYRQGRDESRQ